MFIIKSTTGEEALTVIGFDATTLLVKSMIKTNPHVAVRIQNTEWSGIKYMDAYYEPIIEDVVFIPVSDFPTGRESLHI